MITNNEVIAIGALIRPHGKSGEIQCRTCNELWDDAQATFLIVRIDNILVPFRVVDWRGKGEDLIFRLADIDSEPAAQRLCGNEVFMLRRDIAADTDEQPFFWTDYIGWTVENAGCTITDVDDSTTNILATLSDGRLVPLHEDLITDQDEDRHTLRLIIPEGL